MTDEHVHPFPWRLMGLVAIIVIGGLVVLTGGPLR